MKKQPSKKQKPTSKNLNYRKILRLALLLGGGFVLAAALVAQLFLDVHLYRTVINPGDQSQITSLIIDAVQAIKKPAVVEPVSHKVYIPEADLVLPSYPSDSFNEIEYSYNYTASSSGYPAELQVTDYPALNMAIGKTRAIGFSNSGHQDSTAMFETVPNLQACSRGIHIFFDAKAGEGNGFTKVATKTVADGRTLYMYDENKCSTSFAPLITYLKQIESY